MPVTTETIQKRLSALGYDPGPIDGVRGRRTAKAIEQFQADKGLAIDGIVGPATRQALFAGVANAPAPDASEPDLPWFEEARRLMGVKEIKGKGNNAVIMDWADDLDAAYAGDAVPWCGLFVAHCIAATLAREEIPAGFLGARSWRRFGRECEPTRGAVLVFWRTDPVHSGNGHVGFYAGEDERSFYVLAGNQSDSVSIARIAKGRLLAARFPATALYGARRRIMMTPTSDPFSVDEA